MLLAAMNALNPDQVLSFLHQSPSLAVQFISQQPVGSQPSTLPQVAPSSMTLTQSAFVPPPPACTFGTPPIQTMAQTFLVQAALIRPYSSLNMLANVAGRTPASLSDLPAQTTISRANQEQLEHTAASGDGPLKRKT